MSAEVDLGTRLYLIDNLSSPMGLITGSLAFFGSEVMSLSSFLSSAGGEMAAFDTKIAKLSMGFGPLTDEMLQYQGEMQAVKDAQAFFNDELAAGNITQMEHAALMADSETELTNLSMKYYEARDAVQALDQEIQGVQQDQEDFAAKVDATQQALLGFGIALGSGVDLAGFVEGIKTATNDAANLQDTMNQMQISIQGDNQNLAAMQNYLFQVSSTSIYTADQVGQGWDLLGEKGYNAAQIMGGLGQQATNLSEAIGSDSSSGTVGATNLLATAMEVFRARAEDAQKYADLLDYAFYNGIPSVDGLRSAFEQVGGRAAMLKIPIDQIVVSLDMLGRAGMTGQQAGAALNYALQALYQPTAAETNELITLGVITANKTSPALKELAQQFRAAGSSMPKFDGTVSSLEAIFKEGQKIGTVPLNETFYQWATNMDLVNNAFYDSNGNARPLIDTLRILYDHLKNLKGDDLAAAMKQLFNVRSGQGAQQLLDQLGKLVGNYDKLTKSQDAHGKSTKDAQTRTNSLNAAQKELSTTFTDFMATVGKPIAQVFQGMLQGLNGFLGGILTGHNQVAQFGTMFLLLGAGLSIVGVIVGLAVVAFSGLFVALGPFILPILAVAAGIALLAAGIAGLVMWIRSTPGVLGPVMGMLKDLGGSIMSALAPLGDTLKQVFNEIMQAIKPIMPTLQFLGLIIAGVLVVALGLLVGIIRGVVGALGALLAGLAHVIGGVVQIIAGIIQFFQGLFQVLIGIFTGNKALMKRGWDNIWGGLLHVVQGIFGVIVGVVMGLLGGLINLVVGIFGGLVSTVGHILMALPGHAGQAFGQVLVKLGQWTSQMIQFFVGLPGAIIGWIATLVNQILGWFAHLFDKLIGHSIIPDMVLGILNWVMHLAQMFGSLISKLVGDVVGFFTGLFHKVVSGIGNWFSELGTIVHVGAALLQALFEQRIIHPIENLFDNFVKNALNFGLNFMKMLAQGIMNGLGAVKNAASNVMNTVKGWFGFHSPTEEGPGSEADQWMPNMMSMFASGIHSGIPKLQNAALSAANVLKGAFSSPTINSMQSSYASTTASISAGNTTIPLSIDGQVVTQVVINRLTGQLQMSGSGRINR